MTQTTSTQSELYDIDVKRIDGTTESMSKYRGQVLLIVNVASRCVLTAQYRPLQSLYQSLRDRGLVVMGFPCNQFGSQEPDSNEQIVQTCSLTYDVDFPMFEKIEVNGPSAHPLYQLLKREAPGFLGSQSIKWNFTKFLVDRSGHVVTRFSPQSSPASLQNAIEKLL